MMEDITEHRHKPDSNDDLRLRAEESARTQAVPPVADAVPLSSDAARQMLHELQVHQIELELQNEELRRAQEALETSRARYFDLYELAPVGYLTLTIQGRIVEANLTAAGLFGVPKTTLIGQPLTRFIFVEDQDAYYFLRKCLFETGAPQSCELRLVKQGCPLLWVHLDTTLEINGDGVCTYRATIGDISDRMQARETKLLQLLSSQRLAAQEEERRHIALELHDDIGQIMTAIHLLLGSNLNQPEASLRKAVGRAQELTREALARTRDLAQNLRPAMLDEFGLLPTLTSYLSQYEAASGVMVKFGHSGLQRRFSPAVEITVFRIVQEALTNVARHADVAQACVVIRPIHDKLYIEVHDEGRGFDVGPTLVNGQSSGLGGMRERVLLLSGKFMLVARPGTGCRMIAELPIAEQAG
jgi:PAS domain S-box-containing protein